MSVTNFKDLRAHLGHNIQCVGYSEQDPEKHGLYIMNVAVECEDCNEVLMDFDNPNN